jgi:hypothetical protein
MPKRLWGSGGMESGHTRTSPSSLGSRSHFFLGRFPAVLFSLRARATTVFQFVEHFT